MNSVNYNELIEWIDSLSNWGKWGKEDNFGTMNFVTPEVKLEALKEVKEGLTVSCSRNVEFFSLSEDTVIQSTRYMLETGEGRDQEDETCNVIGKTRKSAKEQISMMFHGYTITHLDSFSHIFWKGKMYNGRSASSVTSQEGATENSIEALKDGIVSRGILLDVARLKEKKWLDLGESFSRKDLEEAEKKQNIQVRSGDIVLVRTGYCRRRNEIGPSNPGKDGTPGPHPDITLWLHEKEIAIFGSDTSNDVQPPLCPSMRIPVHILSLVSMGLCLLDNADLEQLSKECSKRNRWSFMMIISPLYLKSCTGSPVNPIAIL